jgi:cold shock protein
VVATIVQRIGNVSKCEFNDAKGYGGRPSGEGVFVHFSAIQSSGFRSLQERQAVQFEVAKAPKDLQAESVQLL